MPGCIVSSQFTDHSSLITVHSSLITVHHPSPTHEFSQFKNFKGGVKKEKSDAEWSDFLCMRMSAYYLQRSANSLEETFSTSGLSWLLKSAKVLST